MKNVNEEKFDEDVYSYYEEHKPDLSKVVTIAFIGKVSSGKSSLINAFFERGRNDAIAEVGATSGVTTKVKFFKLDENVHIVDSPGLDDIRKENSEATENFLKSIDIAIFVVSGSADKTQKINFSGVKSRIPDTLFVLNKIDEFDDLDDSGVDEVVMQWRKSIGVDHVFKTCAKGYDPKSRKEVPLRIEGVGELKAEVYQILSKKKKDILLKKSMKDKRSYAISIAVTATLSAAGASLAPGSTVYITGIQMTALSSLVYLYTGKLLDRRSVAGIMFSMLGQNVGKNLFMFASSLIPGVDMVGAVVAATVTAAMLAAVISLLESGKSLDDAEGFKDMYNKTYATVKTMLNISDIKDKGFIERLFNKLV
jgi:small GTP-binding protein